MTREIKQLKRNFLAHQKKALQSAKPEVILSGAFGSGKTWTLCNKIVFLLLKYPKNRGFLCRKTLQSLKTTTLKTLLDGDGDLPPALPKHYIKSHNKQDRLITLINGSELFYGNMDREFIKSMNLGFAAVDELTELTEEDWNALGGRLRLPGIPVRQLIAATNPGSPSHWVYSRGYLNPPKDDDGITRVEFIQSSTLDNIYLPHEYIDNLRRTLFGFYFDRYVLGKWVGSDDIVYDNFNSQTHIIQSFTIPKSWKRFRSLDFGYRAPFFCGWFAVAEEDGIAKRLDGKEFDYQKGDMFLYREIYYTQRTASINAERVLELSKYKDDTPEKVSVTVADWDSGDRAEFESKSIYSIAANKDITVGIQKVRERLGNADPTKGQVVRSRFYIFNDSLAEYDPKIRLNLENGGTNNNPTKASEEFMVYSWKPNKEEPIDDYNHALDGIRYFIMAYDGVKMWANVPFLKV
jgi:hypothetical protein